MGASRLVVLVMFDVPHPQLAPDLNQRTLAHFELHEHQWRQVALRVVVRKVREREAEVWVVGRAQNIVCIAGILHRQHVLIVLQ